MVGANSDRLVVCKVSLKVEVPFGCVLWASCIVEFPNTSDVKQDQEVSLAEKLGMTSIVKKDQEQPLTEKLGIISNSDTQPNNVVLLEKLGFNDPKVQFEGGVIIEAIDPTVPGTPLIAGATYTVFPFDKTISEFDIIDGSTNDNDGVLNGRVVFSPLRFGSYNFTMTTIPTGFNVLGNSTIHEAHNTQPNGTSTFRLTLQTTNLSLLAPTIITDSPSLNSTTFDEWTIDFIATVVNETKDDKIIDAVNQLPSVVSVGKETSSTEQQNAVEQQATVELDTSFIAGTLGTTVIEAFAMPNFTLPESIELISIIPTIVTIPSDDSQFIASPPVNTIIPGQTVVLPVEDSSIPSTGGLSEITFTADPSAEPVGSPPNQWLVIEVDDKLPSGTPPIPTPNNNELQLFVDIKFSFEETGLGTDLSDPATFASNPVITVQTPKAEAGDEVIPGTSCAQVDVFFLDGSTWTTASIVDITMTEQASFCELEIELEHFSSYSVSKRRSSGPSGPSGPSGSPGGTGGTGSTGAGVGGGEGFPGIIGPDEIPVEAAASFYDVKVSIDDGRKRSAENPGASCVDTYQSMKVSAIVDSESPLRRAELRLIQEDQSPDEYIAIRMQITNMTVGPTFQSVQASIPWELITGSPALKYWIHVFDEDLNVTDSEEYLIIVNPGYSILGNLEVDVVTVKVEGSKAKPIVYLSNSLDKSIAGVISLIVSGEKVYTSKPIVFDAGQTSVPLEWIIPKIGQVVEYKLEAIGEFCGTILETNEITFNSFPRTLIEPLTDTIDVNSLNDDEGKTIARAAALYSSNSRENTNYRVTSPDGTCVIGSTEECLVQESTFGMRGNLQSVNIDNQIFRVRYSGTDNVLERFTITSIDPIIGLWKVYEETRDTQIPYAYADKPNVIKIKYRAFTEKTHTGFSEKLEEDSIGFGGIISSAVEQPITFKDVKIELIRDTNNKLANIIVKLDQEFVSSSETYNKYLKAQPLQVSAIISKPLEFERAELRIITAGQSADDYHAIKMDVSDMQDNTTFSVATASVPWKLIDQGPAIEYWIQLLGGEEAESEKFIIGISSQYLDDKGNRIVTLSERLDLKSP